MNSLLKNVFLILLFVLGTLHLQAEDIPTDSIYQISTPWKSQENESVALKKFSGQPVIIAMSYTGCKYSCPMTVNKLMAIENDLIKKGVKKYHFILASFDPVHDTPEVLKAFMKNKKLNKDRWTFLKASSDADVRELAAVLGVSYQRLDEVDFSHSNQINVLDQVGRPWVQLKGIAADHSEIIEKLTNDGKKL